MSLIKLIYKIRTQWNFSTNFLITFRTKCLLRPVTIFMNVSTYYEGNVFKKATMSKKLYQLINSVLDWNYQRKTAKELINALFFFINKSLQKLKKRSFNVNLDEIITENDPVSKTPSSILGGQVSP